MPMVNKLGLREPDRTFLWAYHHLVQSLDNCAVYTTGIAHVLTYTHAVYLGGLNNGICIERVRICSLDL